MTDVYPTEFILKCATDESYNGELVSPLEFQAWLRKVKADAWAEGQHAGWCEGYSHGEPEPNPYRD